MGNCKGRTSVPATERSLSVHISKELIKEKNDIFRLKKILFLGAGGCGKSTVFKQLRQIHGDGFGDNDKIVFKKHIHTQIISQMKASLQIYIDWNHHNDQKVNDAADEEDDYDELSFFDDNDLVLDSEAMNEEALKCADLVMDYKYDRRNGKMETDIVEAIKVLWNEPVIKEIYKKRNVTRIETSTQHFWDKIDTVCTVNYLPSDEDIMLCRVQTVGLHEMDFEVRGDKFNIIDVGGQRSQRRKWIHCFEYVVAVIFISSLSCYDEILDEDLSVNAMQDQIELFDDICNNPALAKVAMILFLNKKDLFQEKHVVDKIPLNVCPVFDYYDETKFDFEEGTKFISEEFSKLNKTPGAREIFCHITCATDTNNVEKVFADVQLVVISNALAEGGYMDYDED